MASTPKNKSNDQDITAKPMTSKEIKELRRVHERLCNFSDKIAIQEQINSIKQTQHERNENAISVLKSQENDEIVASENNLIKQLENDLQIIVARGEHYIRPQDMQAAFRFLAKKKISKKESIEMVWEVDEKLDGVVDWEEFLLMFERNIRDTSGLEPASMHHFVQFLIYDENENGFVSIDEVMDMLYSRYGRESMEKWICLLFGSNDGVTPVKEIGTEGGEIDFLKYFDVVENERRKMFWESEYGQLILQKKKKK